MSHLRPILRNEEEFTVSNLPMVQEMEMSWNRQRKYEPATIRNWRHDIHQRFESASQDLIQGEVREVKELFPQPGMDLVVRNLSTVSSLTSSSSISPFNTALDTSLQAIAISALPP
jgi:hypothetical protein